MDWVWYLFGLDGRINRAKAWMALPVIVTSMLLLATLMLVIEQMFGNPVKSIKFNLNDIFGMVDPAVVRAAITRLREGKEASPAHLVLSFFHAAGTLIFSWIYLAIAVKRLHDRDKSGWWAIPYLVIPGLYAQFHDRLPDSYLILPLSLTAFLLMPIGWIEIYFLRGTDSANRFGPDPLSEEQSQPRHSRSSSSGWDQMSAIELVPHQASVAVQKSASKPPQDRRADF